MELTNAGNEGTVHVNMDRVCQFFEITGERNTTRLLFDGGEYLDVLEPAEKIATGLFSSAKVVKPL